MKRFVPMAITACLLLAAPIVAQTDTVATPVQSASMIDWQPLGDFAEVVLSVSGSDGFHIERVFSAGSSLSLELFDDNGQPFPDGAYTYELRATPRLSQSILDELSAARESGDMTIVRQMRQQGILPDEGSLVQGGGFRIFGGQMVAGDIAEEAVSGGSDEGLQRISSADLQKISAADQVILDDLIVDGSICAGLDCVNGESFGFDTLRLKENNLRIKFQDTSSSASFPSNDWQITANDSSNGGLNKFSIDDIDGGRTPFTIEASAPSHSLYVDDGGRMGFGTNTPVVRAARRPTATARPCAWSRTAPPASPPRPGTWPATRPTSSFATPATARSCPSASIPVPTPTPWPSRPATTSAWAPTARAIRCTCAAPTARPLCTWRRSRAPWPIGRC